MFEKKIKTIPKVVATPAPTVAAIPTLKAVSKPTPKVFESPKVKKVEVKKKKIKKTRIIRVNFFDKFGLSKEKSFFLENFSMLLASGMNINDILVSLEKEVRSKKMKALINGLLEDIESGSAIWAALGKRNLFSQNVLALIRVGEETGRLNENLKVVAEQQNKDRMFKSRLRSAMFYPAIVICVTLIVAIGISWFILPRFVTVFKQVDVELPFMTKVLVVFGEIFMNYGSVLVPAFILILLFSNYLLFVFNKTKIAGQWILYHVPITKKLIQEIELTRFGFILGTLLNAGLPIVDALESLADSSNFYIFKKLYLHLKEKIGEGNNFTRSFESFKHSENLVPFHIQQMISSSEQSGRLPETLIRIGDIYESKTEITTKTLTTVLEPILLIIIGCAVLFVALAIITPIYGLLGKLGNG